MPPQQTKNDTNADKNSLNPQYHEFLRNVSKKSNVTYWKLKKKHGQSASAQQLKNVRSGNALAVQ